MKLLTAFSVFTILILAAPVSNAQEFYLYGSRAQALGGASVSLADSWSVFGNQAGLATTRRLTIGGTFQSRFLIKELSSASGILILQVQSSVFAFSVYQFGKTSFRHEKFGFTFARSLNPRLHFGLQFNYYRFFMAEENQAIGTFGAELGFQYQLNNRLLLGFHSLNPYKISVKPFSGEYAYPSRYNIGAHYQLSDSFGLVTEVEKELSHRLLIKTGLEYAISSKLFIRTGISGKPYQLSAGMGFAVSGFKIDMAVAYNQYLGNSPSVSFQYQF